MYVLLIVFNYHFVYNSVMQFDPVRVNVSFTLVHVHVNVGKSVSYHLRVSSLGKPMFINLVSVCSLNFCNAVKTVSSAHHIHKVFSSNLWCYKKQMYFLLQELNPIFFSLVISSRNLQNFSSSAKFCMFFMINF